MIQLDFSILHLNAFLTSPIFYLYISLWVSSMGKWDLPPCTWDFHYGRRSWCFWQPQWSPNPVFPELYAFPWECVCHLPSCVVHEVRGCGCPAHHSVPSTDSGPGTQKLRNKYLWREWLETEAWLCNCVLCLFLQQMILKGQGWEDEDRSQAD
jgi:hypothetical protein